MEQLKGVLSISLKREESVGGDAGGGVSMRVTVCRGGDGSGGR